VDRGAGGQAVAGETGGDVGLECSQAAADQPGCAVRVPAGAAAGDQRREPLDLGRQRGPRPTAGHLSSPLPVADFGWRVTSGLDASGL
jgi:hypothetical protein